MADNLQLNLGSGGSVLAADDISSVFFQRIKLDLGVDGSSVEPSVNQGIAGTGTLRVTLATDDILPLTSLVDDAAFTPATSRVMMAGFEFDDTAPDSVDEGDAGAGRMSANRNIYTTIRDAAGNERGANVDGNNALLIQEAAALDVSGATLTVNAHAVTNAGTFLVQEDGGVLTALEIMDDWDESNRAKVNPIVGQAGVAAGAGAVGVTVPRVTLASDDPAVVALQIMEDWDESDRAKVNIIAGQVGVQGASGGVTALTQRVVLATDVALPAGTAAIGKLAANVGVDIGDVTMIPKTSGGLSFFKSIDLDETEEAVKATAGQVYNIKAFNMTAAPLFLKFYNATVASVIVGTTVPDRTIPIPANADSDGAGFISESMHGAAFGTAITVACTTGVADNDAGAPAANACIVDIEFN